MVVTEVIEVPRPVVEAFAYVADFTTTAEWDPGISASTRIEGDGKVGTRYKVLAEFRGKSVPFVYTVSRFEQDRLIELDGLGDKARSYDTISFAAIDAARTRITYAADFKLRGIIRVAEPLLRSTFERLSREALAGLATTLGATPETRSEPAR